MKKFSAKQKAAALAAAKPAAKKAVAIAWDKGIVTKGGGVKATIAQIKNTRGPNKNPTKEQVAVRFDADVLAAFRAGGAGWQTRMNAALKEWVSTHKPMHKAGRGIA